MNPTDRQIQELRKGMEGLAYEGASRLSGKGLRAGLKVTEKAIQAAAPVGKTRKVRGKVVHGGAVKASVGSRVQKSKGRGNIIRGKVGLNVGKGRPTAKGSRDRKGNLAPHAHFPALGTRPRWRGVAYGYRRQRGKPAEYDPKRDRLTGKRIAYTGVMPRNDFVRRATAASEGAAIDAMAQKIAAELPGEVAKARRGAK